MTKENDLTTPLTTHPSSMAPDKFPESLTAERLAPPPTLNALIADDDRMNAELSEITKGLAAIREEMQRLAANERVLAELNRQYQALAERFHEREVLAPIFLQLIGIADRCRQTETVLKKHLAKTAVESRTIRTRYFELLLDARRADRVEIENILANFGVEPFEHPDDAFDPSIQTCVARELIDDPNCVGKIAHRLRPGYRRNGQVIRPECVAVYAAGSAGAKD